MSVDSQSVATPTGALRAPGARGLKISRRRFGALAFGAGAAGMLSRLPVSARSGASTTRIVDFEWIDPVRGRAVPARLYWPAQASRAAPAPLVVFSHGLGGSRQGYRYLGERWSASGSASLHFQHVGSDRSIWGGNPILLLDRLENAAQEREAIERARDLSHALDRLLDRTGPFHAAIDRTRLVAAGHSYGANTTLIVSGARVIRNGSELGYRDGRFRAGIVISAPPFYGETDLRAVLGSVDVPTLHVTATEDTIRLPGRYSPVQDRIDIFNAIPTDRKALVVFQGGSHSMFTDRAFTGGQSLNPQVKQATAEVGLAFLDLVFRADPAPLDAWGATWKPILAAAPVPFPIHDRRGVRRPPA